MRGIHSYTVLSKTGGSIHHFWIYRIYPKICIYTYTPGLLIMFVDFTPLLLYVDVPLSPISLHLLQQEFQLQLVFLLHSSCLCPRRFRPYFLCNNPRKRRKRAFPVSIPRQRSVATTLLSENFPVKSSGELTDATFAHAVPSDELTALLEDEDATGDAGTSLARTDQEDVDKAHKADMLRMERTTHKVEQYARTILRNRLVTDTVLAVYSDNVRYGF
jgi:hypothetical protein